MWAHDGQCAAVLMISAVHTCSPCTSTHARTHASTTHTRIHSHAHALTHTNTLTRTHSHEHTLTNTLTRTRTRTCTRTCTRTRTHTLNFAGHQQDSGSQSSCDAEAGSREDSDVETGHVMVVPADVQLDPKEIEGGQGTLTVEEWDDFLSGFWLETKTGWTTD